MHEVIMPKLGLTMESGTIEKWHKKEGDKVETGDVLFEVMTDKVSLEVEAYNSGYLKKILKQEGEEVPVTEVVAYIGQKDEKIEEGPRKEKLKKGEKKEPTVEATPEAIDERKQKIKASPLAKRIAKEKGINLSEVEGSGPGGRITKDDVISSKGEQKQKRIKISPLAKKTAKEQGIDYTEIEGSGPGGRIVKEDIASYSKKEERKPAQKEGISVKSSTPLKGIRKVVAERMSQSKKDIPHIVLNAKADVENLISLRERLKDKILKAYDIKVTYTDFLIKICAASLKENIALNSTLKDQEHIIYEDINIGMAVAIEEGLIVPTIFSADKLSILDIAKKRIQYIEKANQGKLKVEEIKDGTFTLTNLGMYNVRSFSAIINPPQAAILAIGTIYREPAVVGKDIVPRSFMELSLSADHRIVDGAAAAKFLGRVVEFVENPELLVV